MKLTQNDFAEIEDGVNTFGQVVEDAKELLDAGLTTKMDEQLQKLPRGLRIKYLRANKGLCDAVMDADNVADEINNWLSD